MYIARKNEKKKRQKVLSVSAILSEARARRDGGREGKKGGEAVFRSRVQTTSDLLVRRGRGEASRVWFRVDRGESQCIAPVGATSWLRAFVVTSGTPVADSAESCTT